MIPSIAIAAPYAPPPTPVVNTTVAGSSTLHVPYDNVAPSVSSVQINNNARGNSTATPSQNDATDEGAASTTETQTGTARALAQIGGQIASPQTTFLAQLAAQEDSPQSQVILVQYEKLVAFSNVKYKPSNALKPQAEPSGVFSKLVVHDNHAPAPVEHTQAPATAPQDLHNEAAPAAEHPVEVPVQAPVANDSERNKEVRHVSPGHAAYTASIARIHTTRISDAISDSA